MSSSVIYLRFRSLLEPVLFIWILLENCHYHLGFYASWHEILYSIFSQFPNVLCNCSLFICAQSMFTDSRINSFGMWSWKNPANAVEYLSPGEDIRDSQLGCLVLHDSLSALAWEITQTGSGMRSNSWHRGSLRLEQGVEENCIFLWATIFRKRDHPLLGSGVICEHHWCDFRAPQGLLGCQFHATLPESPTTLQSQCNLNSRRSPLSWLSRRKGEGRTSRFLIQIPYSLLR